MNIEESKKELREYRDNIKYIEEMQNDAEELKSRIGKLTANVFKNINMIHKEL